jgi:hypothetical protein
MTAKVMDSNFVNPVMNIINKIAKPKNKIIERLQKQMQFASSQDPMAGYTRMHNRHNRS